MKKLILLILPMTIIMNNGWLFSQDHLVISELAILPTAGEFIELYNPTSAAVDPTNYHIADAIFAGDPHPDYVNIVDSTDNAFASDFIARFPPGSLLNPGECKLFALNNDFNTQYGFDPHFETNCNSEDDSDGVNVLIKDVDIAIWDDKAEAVDKTGVKKASKPDTNNDSTEYKDAAPVDEQIVIDIEAHAFERSWQKVDPTFEYAESSSNGNGITGHDETSGNLAHAFSQGDPTLGGELQLVEITFEISNADDLYRPYFIVDDTSYDAYTLTFNWIPGSQHTVEASAFGENTICASITNFIGWNDGVSATKREIIVPSFSTTYIALYENSSTFHLIQRSNGTATQSIPVSEDGYYPDGTTITCQAFPDGGYIFKHWLAMDRAHVETEPYLLSNNNPIELQIGGCWLDIWPVFELAQVIEAPTNFLALANGNSVNLTWQDNSTKEDGFKIERKTGSNGTWSQIATVGANATNYTNSGVFTNQTYYYRVRAYSGSNNSDYSNEYFTITMTAPTNLVAAAVSDSQTNLTWTDNATGETGYKIERGTAGSWSEIADVPANSTSYQDAGLTPGTTYTYRLRAYANSTTPTPHYSDYSNEASATPSAEPFTDILASLIGIYGGSAVWGDYDNDGDLDILLTGFTGSNPVSKVYRNDNGTFVDISAPLTGVGNGQVESWGEWGDYDNDGDLDILLTGPTGVIVPLVSKLYRNDAGSFTEISTTLPGVGEGTVAWGDYDNDGDLDILTTGTSPSAMTKLVYRNDGGGNFVDIGAPLGVRASSGAWGDHDNDGDLDILLAGTTDGSEIGSISKIYRNDRGSFVDTGASLAGVYFSSVAWGDYDNDGDLDILLTGLDASTMRISKVYRNDGGRFVDISAPLIGVQQGSVAWGDYDNDGDLDILLTGWTDSSNRTSKVYRNDGGNFMEVSTMIQGIVGSSVDWGDYDNDGDLDILLTGSTGSSGYISKVYRNNISSTNSIPTTPTNLKSSVIGNSVTLSWDKANDSQTAQNGLTYNLRVGTTQGGNEIVSPMAIVPSGYRKIPKLGNTNHNDSWTIRNLLPGTYYWGVQAIDNAFAGSAFAPEQTFNVQQTSINAPSNLVALALGSFVNLTWTDNSNNEDGFKIERKTGAGGSWSQIAVVGSDGTDYTDSGLATNRTYYYRVRAYRGSSHSDYTNEYFAITMAAPINLTASAVSGSQIILSWTDNPMGETGFKIERRTTGSWSEIADVPANSASYQDTRLSSGTTYTYRVRAYANSTTPTPHYSNYSNEDNATTEGTVIENFVLGFPLDGQDAYTAMINSIFDHSLATASAFYLDNGETIAFTGELGKREYGQSPVNLGSKILYGFRNSNGTTFIVNGNYKGGGESDFLFYDGHPGFDYKASTGTPIYAPAEGEVIVPTLDPINGDPATFNTIMIDHGNCYSTWFLHCSKHLVTTGHISKGQAFAEVGSQGTGAPHLHFEVRKDGIPIDPYGWQGIGGDPSTGAVNEFLWDISTNQTVWNFDETFERWRTRDALNQGINKILGGKWVIDPGSDPGIISPTLTAVNASDYREVEIRMAVLGGGEIDQKNGQVFFTTEQHPIFSASLSVEFDEFVIRDGNQHIYRADMNSNPNWTGNVTSIRIDPIANGDPHSDSDKIFIDYVKLNSINSLALIGNSPIDLIVIDPNGLEISKDTVEVFDASYIEGDIDEDGESEDFISINNPTEGTFEIFVVAEPEANLSDTFSIISVMNGDSTVLVDEVPIQDIPTDSYSVNYSKPTFGEEPTGSQRPPDKTTLFQNYPNPFNPETTIEYQIPKKAKVSLKIYNLMGQEIVPLVNEEKVPGYYKAIWDGKDAFGQQVASGIYVYRLRAGDFVASKKLILLR